MACNSLEKANDQRHAVFIAIGCITYTDNETKSLFIIGQ
ncbi:hypothetical protein VP96_03795 [Vibrio cholerae]|nr:hypothetical protein VCD_000821 [Vibrio cholerae MJ-1236]EEO11473.1 hypothetical protein VCC_000638 [Vibrio cholerae RC9]EEO14732.1 hypothetical protein VCB_001013 [Vibrio cholerae TMA 21]EEO18446.1 hypothetical protein VCE_000959 [Vibrio cholerae B33]EEO21591.1 hypothetical protein VCF_001538 [Vibrio cholerae BX 330286]KKP07926.1 hypothetical protein VS85_03556 [Vibrio cholerae]